MIPSIRTRITSDWRPFPIFEVTRDGSLLTNGKSWFAFGKRKVRAKGGVPIREAPIALSPDGRILVHIREQKNDWFYRCEIHWADRSRSPLIYQPWESFFDVAFSDDSGRILLTNWDGTVMLLDRDGNELFRRQVGTGAVVAFSPSGDQFVAGTDHGRLILFDIKGTKLWEIKLSSPPSV